MFSCFCENNDCLLCEAQLSNAFSSEQVCQVRGLIVKNNYGPRDILFHQGQSGDHIHVVRDGLLKLKIADINGHEQIIGLGLMGHMVGFDSLGDNQHAYTAETLTPVQTCSIRHKDMMDILNQNPAVSQRAIIMLNQELAASQKLIHLLGQKSSVEKLALFILSLIPPAHEIKDYENFITVLLPLSRKEIAQFLGLTIETISRTLSDFKKREFIDTPRGAITILDVMGLTDIAGIDSQTISQSIKMMLNQPVKNLSPGQS